ncbi:hypothetical protein [Trichocoleus sp. FACHB-262]|uniref:hypothetical protein n=1 Tax=Trichocoleus sp. FACHB-262 TaxID=2692869 RepID=UPI001A7ED244|nr:hypothetical protein [Trichocoleus sp. FACHB-262]
MGDRSIAANTASSTPHWLNPMERFTPTETLVFQNLGLNTAVEEVERAAVNCEIAGFATSITAQETQPAFIRYQQARIALASKILRSQTP